MSETLFVCNICLKNDGDLVRTSETDACNIKWTFKLASCVPEVDWNEDNLMCKLCREQLDTAWRFRELCIKSQSTKQPKEEDVKDCAHLFQDVKDCNNLLQDVKDCHRLLQDHRSDSETEPAVTCDACNIEFATRVELFHHQKYIHTIASPYKCAHCNESFESNTDLSQHEKTHDKLVKCEHCHDTACDEHLSCKKHVKLKHSNPKQCVVLRYECEKCESKFSVKSHLNRHMRVCSGTNPSSEYICYHCHKSFRSKLILATHIRTQHGTKKSQNKCPYCEQTFLKKIDLNVHLKLHHKEEVRRVKKFKCSKCNRSYATEDCLRSHLDTCDGKPIDVINKCEICGVVFSSKYLIRRHVRNVHAVEKKYKCETCGQKFASPVYLSAHKRYHSGERSHICSFCGKAYITASDLYHHEKIHANKRAYRCEKCPKAFNTSSDLHKHKICVHVDRSLWKYVCTVCDRRFPLKTNLDTHTKTHTGEKNFACHMCDRRCINQSVLKRHIESHSNVRSFKCNLCDQDYKYQKSLNIHKSKAHGIGDVKIPERIKKYFCHICPKSFFANNKLQKHIRSHTGERPFPCHMCEKRFVDKSYVKQHLKTAHNVIILGQLFD